MSRRDGLHESYCRPSAHAHANIQDHAICRAAACRLGSMLRPYDVLDSTIQQRRAEIRFGLAMSSRSACLSVFWQRNVMPRIVPWLGVD